jgi:hypothetical protein
MRSTPFAICLAAWLVAALAISYFSSFGLTYRDLRNEALAEGYSTEKMLADNLLHEVTAQIRGGMTLRQLTIGGLLRDYCALDQGIVGISVVSNDGVIVSDCDPWRIGTLAPSDWRRHERATVGRQNRAVTTGTFTMSLREAGRGVVGSLILRYTVDDTPAINAALLRLTQIGLGGLAFATFLVMVVILVLAQVPNRAMHRAIGALRAGSAPASMSAVAPDLEALWQSAHSLSARIDDELRRLMRIAIGDDSPST